MSTVRPGDEVGPAAFDEGRPTQMCSSQLDTKTARTEVHFRTQPWSEEPLALRDLRIVDAYFQLAGRGLTAALAQGRHSQS
jgi:hypothetical protein